MNAVELRDIHLAVQPHFWSKRTQILSGLSFDVGAGRVVGFLGPNGAGKTTSMRIILGLSQPDRGTVRVLGSSCADPKVRAQLGFMPERAYFPEHLSATELVLQHALLAGLSYRDAKVRSAAVLERVGLATTGRKRLRDFSKGMLQRAGFAQAIVAEPRLVLLDEPMSGLDPMGRRDFRELILGLRAGGATVFFSTHILPDVESICDDVVMLRAGRILRSGPLADMLRGTAGVVEVRVAGLPAERLTTLPTSQPPSQRGDTWVLHAEAHAADSLIDAVRAAGGHIVEVETTRRSLEDVFVEAAGDERGP